MFSLHSLDNSWCERILEETSHPGRASNWDPCSATKSPMDINVWTPALRRIWPGWSAKDGVIATAATSPNLQIKRSCRSKNLNLKVTKCEAMSSSISCCDTRYTSEAVSSLHTGELLCQLEDPKHPKPEKKTQQKRTSCVANLHCKGHQIHQLPLGQARSQGSDGRTTAIWQNFSMRRHCNQFSLRAEMGRTLQNSSLNQTRNRSRDR